MAKRLSALQEQTWSALEARWERMGFEGLAEQEQEAIALFWLEAEVMNGGLCQYFANSSGDLALIAVRGLENAQAKTTLGLFRKAMSKLSPDGYQIDRGERQDALEQLGMDTDPFDAETTALQKLPEDFWPQSLSRLGELYAQQAVQGPTSPPSAGPRP